MQTKTVIFTVLTAMLLGVSMCGSIELNTPSNDWGNGNVVYLDRHDISCPGGSALTAFRLFRPRGDQIAYNYRCEQNPNISGNTYADATPWNEEGNGQTNYLDRHNIQCRDNFAIQRFKLNRNGQNRMRYDFACAAAAFKNCAVQETGETDINRSYQNIYLDRQNINLNGRVLNRILMRTRYFNGGAVIRYLIVHCEVANDITISGSLVDRSTNQVMNAAEVSANGAKIVFNSRDRNVAAQINGNSYSATIVDGRITVSGSLNGYTFQNDVFDADKSHTRSLYFNPIQYTVRGKIMNAFDSTLMTQDLINSRVVRVVCNSRGANVPARIIDGSRYEVSLRTGDVSCSASCQGFHTYNWNIKVSGNSDEGVDTNTVRFNPVTYQVSGALLNKLTNAVISDNRTIEVTCKAYGKNFEAKLEVGRYSCQLPSSNAVISVSVKGFNVVSQNVNVISDNSKQDFTLEAIMYNISGSVRNALSNSVLNANNLKLSFTIWGKTFTTTVNGDSKYQISLPEGQIAIDAAVEKYQLTTGSIVIVSTNLSYDIMFTPHQFNVRGFIKNARTNSTFSDNILANNTPNITFTSHNRTFQAAVINGSRYEVNVPVGVATVKGEMRSFSNQVSAINVVGVSNEMNDTNTVYFAAIKREWRVVLKWGDKPHDMDLKITDTQGSSVGFLKKSSPNGNVSIVKDVRTGNGPEEAVIKTDANGVFLITVVNFTQDATFKDSKAEVSIYNGDNLVQTFKVPETDTLKLNWKVATIDTDNNLITPVNTFFT